MTIWKLSSLEKPHDKRENNTEWNRSCFTEYSFVAMAINFNFLRLHSHPSRCVIFFLHLICHVEIVVLQKNKQKNFSHSRGKFSSEYPESWHFYEEMKKKQENKVRNFDDISCQFLSFWSCLFVQLPLIPPVHPRPFSFIHKLILWTDR
jgi:hypothetical protein